MQIKNGDLVKILAGKDRNKSGKVLKTLEKERRVVVEGLNLLTKNLRPKRQNEKGQQVKYPAPLDLSKVMLMCSGCSKPTRVGYIFNEDKSKTRICKKCGEKLK